MADDEEKAAAPLFPVDDSPADPPTPPPSARTHGPVSSVMALTLLDYAAKLPLEWAVVSFVYDSMDTKKKKCIFNFSEAGAAFNLDRHAVVKLVKEWTLYRDYPGEAPKTRLPRKM
jgi:hypothetical protein